MRHLLSLLLLIAGTALAAQTPIYSSQAIHHPVVGKNGMVGTQHPEATRVGLEILQAGGNAVDAAVAVGFSLAVVLPRAGNLGGGGFMLVYDAEEKKTEAINYREMAPAKASRNMYLNAAEKVDRRLLNSSYQASGVPGSVAGLALALEKYGTLSLRQVLAPAIKLAEEGFPVTHDLAGLLKSYQKRLRQSPNTEAIFYKGKDGFYEAGEILRQPDLAWSLRQIAEQGPAAFYGGAVGQKICADMRRHNGLIEEEDLKNYKAAVVEPQWGEFNGYRIASMPPPSSGGVHIIQMLNILDAYDLKSKGHNSAATIHLMSEAMKLAYADRSKHLGDPSFWQVPDKGLTSTLYAEKLRKRINENAATPSGKIAPGQPQDYESEETTHFSVMDGAGNVVSNTYTLNFSFGSGIVAAGTGILLNNEMSDFAAKPGEADAYGLIGGEANAIQPGKRPLSSMTPTIVFNGKEPYLATGSPGGSRIITTVLQILLNVLEHDLNIAEATHAPRVHHQWYPDKLFIERGLNTDTQSLLKELGHTIEYRNAMGSTQTILRKDGLLYGSSDPRRPDARTRGF